jgi:hypothetical protein
MKRCPTCQRPYTDLSLNFCTEDGTPLIEDRGSDLEADTLRVGAGFDTTRVAPKKPEMSVQDIIMEIADYLRRNVSPGEIQLIRFEPLTGLGISITQISDNFLAAAEKANCEVTDKTDMRATVRRRPTRLERA